MKYQQTPGKPYWRAAIWALATMIGLPIVLALLAVYGLLAEGAPW